MSFELLKAEALVAQHGGPCQEPFSLLFRAPREYGRSQGRCDLEHEGLGRLDIFLVPIDEDESGIYLEAIFN